MFPTNAMVRVPESPYLFWLGMEAPPKRAERDTWASIATAYGYEADGFITVLPPLFTKVDVLPEPGTRITNLTTGEVRFIPPSD
jgi:hypothetical protein